MISCGVSWCGMPYGKAEVPGSAILAVGVTSKWQPAFCSPRCRDLAAVPIDAGTGVGAGAMDRAACKAFCGHMGGSEVYARAAEHVFDGGAFARPDFAMLHGTSPRWCSDRCRDLALPPLEAKPAAPPSPAPGQRWRSSMTLFVYDVIEACPQRGWHLQAVRGDGQDGYDEWITRLTSPRFVYLGPTPATPTPSAIAPPASHAPGVMALGSRPLSSARAIQEQVDLLNSRAFGVTGIDCGHKERTGYAVLPRQEAPKPTRVPGITCRHCLLTSAGGKDHLPACTRNDVLTADSWLTSEAWSTQVRRALERIQDEQEKAARPFVPSITDEDLFGRPAR